MVFILGESVQHTVRSGQAITSAQMYAIEEKGDRLGMKRFLMMENAGHGIADYAVGKFSKGLANKQVVAVCGTGNNGGDGFVAARHLARHSKIDVVLLGSYDQIKSEEAKMNWTILRNMADSIRIEECGEKISAKGLQKIQNADIIIDAIFGTGIRGEILEPYSSAIRAINSSDAFRLAVDVPSGYDPNTGKPHDICVVADSTVTFHRLKVGMTRKNRYTGSVHLELIGIPPEAEKGII